MMCGGFGNARDADDKVKALAKEVKPEVEKALGATYSQFEAVKFTTQVVAGTNYKIKVKVGDGQYVHIKVFVPLPCNNAHNKLLEQEAGKTLADAL
jgi:cystatin-A/B